MATLIPDTSSLIRVSDVHIGRMHITDLLMKIFTIQVPIEIPREVKRHKSKFNGYEMKAIHLVNHCTQRFNRERDYEWHLFNGFSPTGNHNKSRGERYSCSLALYQARKRITGHTILLSDDINAHRGFITWFEERFRVTKAWTSLDLLVYIHLVVYPKYPLAQALNDLQKVNARIGGVPADVTTRLLSYRRYLNDSHALLGVLPTPRVRGIL